MNCQTSRKGWMFFDLLLKRFHPRDSELIVQLLTRQEQTSYQAISASFPPSQLEEWLTPQSDVLAPLHPEWIVQSLSAFTAMKRNWILAALPRVVSAEICQLGKWQPPGFHVYPACVQYLLQELLQPLQGDDYIPVEALPKQALSPLLDLTSEELEEVVCGMGLRDLAEVVRGIVDQKFLRTLYSCLKPQEQKLLRNYIHQKERLKSAPINLQTWDKKSDSLRALFRERGLLRMSKALFGQSNYFLWHLLHRFSPTEAKRIQRFMRPAPQPEITTLLIQQLLLVIPFVQRKSA